MSLQIYIAHTGEHLLADPVSFASPDALRSWIARNTSIPAQRQILMTARGKNVKLQTLATEDEIFVYDRQFVSDHRVGELPNTPLPEPFNPDNPPDRLADQNNLQAWRDLYMARRAWALNLASQCNPINKAIDDHNARIDVIHRAIGVALENLKSHVGNLEHKFQDTQAWANDLLKEQQLVLDGWQRALSTLETIPATKDFTFLRRPSTPKKAKDRSTGTLQDYVDVDQVKRAGSQVSSISQRFARRVDEVEKVVHEIVSETEALVDASQPSPLDNASSLLEEVETIARKISSDYEHVLGLPSSSKALASVSRMALNHTKDLLPSMMEMSLEIQGALEQTVKQRNQAMKSAVRHMQFISTIESRLASIQGEISNLDVEGDVFDVLYEVFHLPVIYGSILIECVRRREWSDKMKADSLSLAEELAVFRDEEQRRRKKWAKSMGDLLALADDGTPGVEVNLQSSQEPEWPDVSRKEIEAYIGGLKGKPGMESAVEELKQLFKDLDTPSRQQRRKAKAFKQGSLFDMARSSFMMRGDDMVRSLRDEKVKLEDKLKGSESRVRKLEDLLHRQSHIGRPISGHFGPEIPASPASPRPDTMSRRSSRSSRRMSANNAPEDKALAQRIVALEAELMAEKETVAKLQREAQLERQSSSDKIQEVQSTKRDLMDNLEARQREHEDERKFLESETNKLKIKIEEAEEELDRVDHEKQLLDDKLELLQAELDSAKQRTKEEITDLKATIERQKEERQKLNDKHKVLEERLHSFNETEFLNTLHAAHMHLSPDGSPPAELTKLVKAIEILSEGLAIHAKGSDAAASEATQENKNLSEKVAQMEGELQDVREKLEEGDSVRSNLQELLDETKSKLSAAQSEVDNERSELRALRSKFSAGETGSEVLKERLIEEEKKAAALTEKLAEVESRTHNFQDELLSWKRKVEQSEESGQRFKTRLESRGERAKEMSWKLYTQIELLGCMLQQLGFTIVQQDDTISIQRASKVNNGSLLGESMSIPSIVSAVEEPDLSFWIQADNAEEEEASSYAAMLATLSRFDLSMFSDVVIKRVKDIETVARKWQREARNYREKYHRFQAEAHDKIAYRTFKEGDLALFLPTRNQATRSWAAFNVGAPHYFLREQDAHNLQTRDWLLARISKVEERVVDLSKSINGTSNPDRRSIAETSDGADLEDDNPFGLSDGLRWYLLDASEERPGAPTTPGLGKSTVASAHVDAKGSIRLNRASHNGGVAKTLTKSLDSRRNSSTSKRSVPVVPTLQPAESAGDNVLPAEGDSNGAQPRREEAPIFDEGMEQSEAVLSPPTTPGHNGGVDTSTPSTPMVSSPSKRYSKSKPWEKLWSLDYRSDKAS
ncbi:hypothetical protein AJ80_00905 [Polytolypa hystricis UAMH7299]|uniref:Autophagy-related protein 11 n=1 Tax=Polytolypa hystricis (strain UAMH7299) TaxID=1447883 RepID=A0A2B7Z3N2_POLH7|nr:hypothetical protein AJ80_00905 [Polytolypa hystricis UAMH7299]